MTRFFAALALLFTLGVPALTQRPGSDTIRLRWAKPSTVVRMMTDPALSRLEFVYVPATSGTIRRPRTLCLTLPGSGEVQIVPDERARTLRVRGDADAVAQVRQMVALMDVRPRQVRIRLRLARVLPGRVGGAREQTLGAPTITAQNNQPATVALRGRNGADYTVVITPRINSDGSITLLTELSRLSPRSVTTPMRMVTVTGGRRILPNKPTRLTVLLDNDQDRRSLASRRPGSSNRTASDGADAPATNGLALPDTLPACYLEATAAEIAPGRPSAF